MSAILFAFKVSGYIEIPWILVFTPFLSQFIHVAVNFIVAFVCLIIVKLVQMFKFLFGGDR